MTTVFGPDPVDAEINCVLELLKRGAWNDSESSLVDLKEERGRRDKAGNVLPGASRNEAAAEHVSGAAACMANTPGGGALIYGVSDSGELIGTSINLQWLRHRVYELTNRAVTLNVRETLLQDARW